MKIHRFWIGNTLTYSAPVKIDGIHVFNIEFSLERVGEKEIEVSMAKRREVDGARESIAVGQAQKIILPGRPWGWFLKNQRGK